MVAQNNDCDRHRLKQLLTDELPSPEVVETHRHLEVCRACRLELESLSADERVWHDLPRFLQQDESDPGSPLSQSPDTKFLGATSADATGLSVETVLDHLQPTDNPAMLGCLGDYDILEVVGSGGMGVVLKGYDRQLNRFVAIKVLAPHFASSAAARKRFAREAKAAAAVVHPHVVSIHGVAAESLPYFVMQFVPGQSLQQRIDSDAPLELIDVLRIGMQAAQGLAAAHSQGLVHRDVKPANILLENGVERVLLSDFGLARAADDASMTQSGVIAGTPQFMSPEQARGERIDSRSDIFSLGSVLYAMCTGHSPFRAETTVGVLGRIYHETPRGVREINSDVPKWLEKILGRMLAKNPDDRFQTADEVAELLGRWLAHVQQPDAVPRPDQENQPTPGGALRPPPKVPRKYLALAGGFLFLFLFATIVLLLEFKKGVLRIECADGNVPIRILKGDKLYEEMVVTPTDDSIRIAAGQYVVEIDGDHDQLEVKNGTVIVTRGEATVVRIVQKAGPRAGRLADPRPRSDPPPAPSVAPNDPGSSLLKKRTDKVPKKAVTALPTKAKLVLSGFEVQDKQLLLFLDSEMRVWDGGWMDVTYEITVDSKSASSPASYGLNLEYDLTVQPAGGTLLAPRFLKDGAASNQIHRFRLPLNQESGLLLAVPFPSSEIAELARERVSPLQGRNVLAVVKAATFDLLHLHTDAVDLQGNTVHDALSPFHVRFELHGPNKEVSSDSDDDEIEPALYQGATLERWLSAEDENAVVRQRSLRKLARIYPDDHRTHNQLVMSLDDDEEIVIFEAALGLALIDTTGDNYLPLVTEWSRSANLEEQNQAAVCLVAAASNVPDAVQSLIALLDEDLWGLGYYQSNRLLTSWGSGPRSNYDDGRISPRRTAIIGLGLLGEKAASAVEIIEKHLSHQDKKIKFAATNAYQQVTGKRLPPTMYYY